MADSIRGTHVSPGVYSHETDITYAVKSLGITTLGLAGETQRGPAFEPMAISNWREFVSTFGGTSTEKFKGSQYPKYELPYIAKSYLTASNQLEVVRVLGLSGYNAGPAWVITAKLDADTNSDKEGEQKDMVVAVLRSRGEYHKYYKFDATSGDCSCPTTSYDTLIYDVGEIERDSEFCNKPTQYNQNALELAPYTSLYSTGNDCINYSFSGTSGSSVSSGAVSSLSATNHGRFVIKGITGIHDEGESYSSATISSGTVKNSDQFEYAVSLNPADKDYILNVLGTSPSDGTAPIYVESLYDVALAQAISNGGEKASGPKALYINKNLTFYQVFNIADFNGLEPVAGILTIPEGGLSRKNIGQRYLADKHAATSGETRNDPTITAHLYNYKTELPATYEEIVNLSGKAETSGDTTYWENLTADSNGLAVANVKVGQIYTVKQYTDVSGKRNYYYAAYTRASVNEYKKEHPDTDVTTLYDCLVYGGNADPSGSITSDTAQVCVKNLSDGLYYRLSDSAATDVRYVDCDMNDYKSSYRYASTPWIVSNLMGDFNNIELKRLFRFHTISDGDASNNEVKVSIENIRTDNNTFDVVVRDINDTDELQVVLERYNSCTLTPGSNNYIAYKIGSYDGVYESKSKYITVECKDSDVIENLVPAGFLGYPCVQFNGTPVIDNGQTTLANPLFTYNRTYDEDVKNRKQYFGLSTRTGVDIDMFKFKGNAAYIDRPEFLTHGFHLDSRLNLDGYSKGKHPTITVDGEKNYKFDAVSQNCRTTTLTDAPIIGTEESMQNTIYEYQNLRKFTVYFYGGFDGWDIYRDERTNTDDFKMSKYNGTFDKNSGIGFAFDRIDDPESLGLNQNGITSDWYAYLAAIRQFANPEAVDINVFATPGIDYVNNTSLVEEAIEMIEEERADSIYVVTTPDKPSGAGDFVSEMYTPEDAVYNLENTDIDSNYTCTYYPWVKYLDSDNNQYIYLPPTKDVVRNFALTDNTTYPWYAPAGINRGTVDCAKAHFTTKLSDEDTLYEGRINPIKTFAVDGVKIWGQKNLQVNESQLNRISVRRLLLRMRKLIAIACRSLIFEPNDTVTKNSFLSTVTPIMDNIKSNRGISDYRIEVNDTAESRERRELPAKIYFKPINALEYILLDFIVTPESVSFDNI